MQCSWFGIEFGKFSSFGGQAPWPGVPRLAQVAAVVKDRCVLKKKERRKRKMRGEMFSFCSATMGVKTYPWTFVKSVEQVQCTAKLLVQLGTVPQVGEISQIVTVVM